MSATKIEINAEKTWYPPFDARQSRTTGRWWVGDDIGSLIVGNLGANEAQWIADALNEKAYSEEKPND